MSFIDSMVRVAFNIVASQTPAAGLTVTDIAWARRAVSYQNERDDWYAFYRDYYAGKHVDPRSVEWGEVTPSATRKFGSSFNYCRRAVDALVERLDITGWAVDGLTSEDAANDLAERVGQWWDGSDGPRLQNTVHRQALVLGDAYLLVEYDNETRAPRFTFHDALGMLLEYDIYHRPIAAYKTWTESFDRGDGVTGTRARLIKYTAGLIEKWADDDHRGWYRWTADPDLDGQPDGGVIKWTDDAGRPLGLPVVHFAWKRDGGDYGRSHLEDMIAPQNQINLRQWFTDESVSFQGAGQTYLANVQAPIDPSTRQPVAYERAPGKVWVLSPLDSAHPVDVGVLDAGETGSLQDVADRAIKTFGSLAPLPSHLIWPEGSLPSGESLRTAEAPLAAVAADAHTEFGPEWCQALSLAARLARVFGGEDIPEGVTFAPQWASVYTRTEEADARVTAIRGDDWSLRERLRRDGYTAADIERILAEREEETSAALRVADQFAGQLQDTGDELRESLARRAGIPGGDV